MRNYILNKVANRKLRKLIRDPKQFFWDSKEMQWVRRVFGWKQFQTNTIAKDKYVTYKSDISGLDRFELVGENWLDNDSLKPIAVLFGFAPWKREYVAAYLTEYRVAYVFGRIDWADIKTSLELLDEFVFVVWSYLDPVQVSGYAEEKNIKIYRMEDGFIRSSDLGSKHTRPLSLVMDSSGLYFDATRPSDLENYLNNFDSNFDHGLKNIVDPLMGLYRQLGVSKYTLGSIRTASSVLGPKIRRRVLVIGQIDGDASIVYGLAKEWTCRKLLELAKSENPDAEIIYKPHPDVIQGFRTNSEELAELNKICRLIMSPVVLSDLFSQVDHVYTITSLAGFEALFHGLKVTVVGMPFYAGWGLTDDRQQCARRIRKLKLDELFCGTILIYPRYLADLNNSSIGSLASILRVVGERRKLISEQLDSKKNSGAANFVNSNLSFIGAGEWWPIIFSTSYFSGVLKSNQKNLLSIVLPSRVIGLCQNPNYQKAASYLLLGRLKGTSLYPALLRNISQSIKPYVFAEILGDLWRLYPSEFLIELWAEHCERVGDTHGAKKAYEFIIQGSNLKLSEESAHPVNSARFGIVQKAAQYELRQRNFELAERLYYDLLLSGHLNSVVISGLAEISRLRFDFLSASWLYKLSNALELGWGNGRGYLLQGQTEVLAGSGYSAIESLAVACLLNPQLAGSLSEDTGVDYFKVVPGLPLAEALVAAIEVGGDDGVIQKAKSYISHELPERAEKILAQYLPSAKELEHYSLTLSQAYSYQGKLDDAAALIRERLSVSPSVLMYREALRLAVLRNDVNWINSLVQDIEENDIQVGEVYLRKAAATTGDIKGYHACFRRMGSSKNLRYYLGDRYQQSGKLLHTSKNSKGVVLTYFGPGDEIRWACLYPKMKELFGDSEVVFTCDKRFHNLLTRSFPSIRFVPVGRVRHLNSLEDFSDFNNIPGSDLFRHFDNTGWDLVRASDSVTLQLDLLGDLVQDYDSYNGDSYLKADADRVYYWKNKLMNSSRKPLVGLSWRSSIQTYSRNHHYLTASDLIPLFDTMPDVQFVNLQYDDCAEELEFLNNLFPGRIINPDGLDQYNELDEVAALMSALEFIVAPATIVIEMAGGLGIPSLFINNSTEANWRLRPGTDIDFWHGTVRHVKGEPLGDKASLVKQLSIRLNEWFNSR